MGNLFVTLQEQTIGVDHFFGGQTLDSDVYDIPALIAGGLLLAPIIPPPGVASNFLRGDGVWAPAAGVVANQKSSVWLSPIFQTSGFGTNRGVAANQIRALYMGKAASVMSSVNLRWETGAAAVAGWAEMALATGPVVPGAGTNLFIRGFVSAVTEWNNVGPHRLNVPVTGADIQIGEDLWGLYAMDIGTTQIRVSTLDVEGSIGRGQILVRNATRPSLNLNTSLAFSLDIVGATPPVIAFDV